MMRPVRRALLICGLWAVGCLTCGVGTATAATPPIKHVFILWLENENYDSTFGAETKIPYLARDLRNKGALLEQYYGTGHLSLDNYLTVVSGQPPNPYTQADAPAFTDFVGTVGSDGVAIGQGTVYPPEVNRETLR